ncbi:MAG TPA: RNA 3'-terminal phosphate cyclase [Fimbriimonadales bacterium]|nr:RNA 3'-terminal phosphate cyclase [Fimbriimonadales bacterium]
MVIDGSFGEGGGQILRSALALSVLTGKAFEMVNVRAKRTKPGLMPQHLKSVEASQRICRAKVEGASIGSMHLIFEPREVRPGEYVFDIGTAGASSLVLQTIFFPLAFAKEPSKVSIIGGTHVPWSPPYHYLEWQWGWLLKKINVSSTLRLERAGFYPKGGGKITANIEPVTSLAPFSCVDRGGLKKITGVSGVGKLPISIAERQRSSALAVLQNIDAEKDISLLEVESFSPGTFIVLVLEFENSRACFSALGARGKSAERVGEEAAQLAKNFLDTDGTIDAHLADQALLPLALAEGKSSFITPEVTNHLTTNAWLITHFLPASFEIMKKEKGSVVEIVGYPLHKV